MRRHQLFELDTPQIVVQLFLVVYFIGLTVKQNENGINVLCDDNTMYL